MENTAAFFQQIAGGAIIPNHPVPIGRDGGRHNEYHVFPVNSALIYAKFSIYDLAASIIRDRIIKKRMGEKAISFSYERLVNRKGMTYSQYPYGGGGAEGPELTATQMLAREARKMKSLENMIGGNAPSYASAAVFVDRSIADSFAEMLGENAVSYRMWKPKP
jgi:hypothetical protein